MPQPAPISLSHATLVELIQRSEGGCQRSAEGLFDLCRQPLLQVIRKVIHRRVRTLFDSDDFLLETFQEIFTHHFQQEMLQSPHRLWAYLKRIAENKVRDAHRKYLVGERSNLRNELFLEDAQAEILLFSTESNPFDNLVLKEWVEEHLAGLINQLPDVLQSIVLRLLEGQRAGEISHAMGIEMKRVYRAMEWLRKKIMLHA